MMYHQQLISGDGKKNHSSAIPSFVRGGSEYRNMNKGVTPNAAAARSSAQFMGAKPNTAEALDGMSKRKKIKKKTTT